MLYEVKKIHLKVSLHFTFDGVRGIPVERVQRAAKKFLEITCPEIEPAVVCQKAFQDKTVHLFIELFDEDYLILSVSNKITLKQIDTFFEIMFEENILDVLDADVIDYEVDNSIEDEVEITVKKNWREDQIK